MFAIRLLPPKHQGPDGEWLGEIVVGDFQECFACYPTSDGTIDDLEAGWRAELIALTRGESVAVLRHDPRFAWLIYREGDECFVQQRFSADGTFGDLLPRAITTEDGDRVSTWVTSVAAIQGFLDA
ncbi:MAG: hypothetical protein O3A18_09620 [Planctomycetota bacterium]|jgi:hypothetical protein|nr:hypothetical protein [Planctomycetota bacterium]